MGGHETTLGDGLASLLAHRFSVPRVITHVLLHYNGYHGIYNFQLWLGSSPYLS